jgi:hypothetical protein
MATCIKDKAHSLEVEGPAVEEELTTARKWREDDVKRVTTDPLVPGPCTS